jgi:hypothetical protein
MKTRSSNTKQLNTPKASDIFHKILFLRTSLSINISSSFRYPYLELSQHWVGLQQDSQRPSSLQLVSRPLLLPLQVKASLPSFIISFPLWVGQEEVALASP